MQIIPSNLRLRPSSANRWVPCPGSVIMEAHYPDDEDSQAAQEGTAAHWVASEGLLRYAQGDVPTTPEYLGKLTPNGIVVTQEIMDAVAEYIRDVMEVCGGREGALSLFVEHEVSISTVHPNNAGTLDGGVHLRTESRLFVWDFKYGWGIVPVFENWQLLDYALGLLQEMHQAGQVIPTEVEFRIVQPRPYHREGIVRTWVITVDQLAAYCGRLRESAASATSDNAPCIPGPHCDNCKGRHACDALHLAVLRHRDIVERALPHELAGAALGNEVTLLGEMEAMVKARKSGIDAQALAEIKRGNHVPGWTTGSTPGRRKWAGTDAEVLSFGEMMGLDLSKPSVKSPAQAEKSGADKDLIASYVVRDPGALKLVPQDKNHVEKVFSK